MVITDEIGTLRLYNYPNVKGEPYYQCYGDHLFKVSDCGFSPDRLFFVSSCEMDRCIFKWQVSMNHAKLQRMVTDDSAMLNRESEADKAAVVRE